MKTTVKEGEELMDGTKYYNANFVFDKQKEMEYILFEEGRIVNDNNNFTFEYHLKDHLGSVRVAFAPTTSGTEIVQENAYYPFGGTIDDFSYNESENRYKHTGMEAINDFGLNMLDNNARWRDVSAVPRFYAIDPLAEKYYFISPYAYCGNNPVRFTDLTGMKIDREGDYDEERNLYYSERYGWVAQDFYSFLTQGGYKIKDRNEALHTFLKASGFIKEEDETTEDDSNNQSSVYEFTDYYAQGLNAFVRTIDIALPFVPLVGDIYDYNSDYQASSYLLGLSMCINVIPGGYIGKGFKYVGKIGAKFLKFERVVPASRLPGEARAVYVKIFNSDGKLVKMYKDTYKVDGTFKHRRNLLPNESGVYKQ